MKRSEILRGSGVGRPPEKQPASNAAVRAFIHDVVNPLAAIRMSADTLRARAQLGDAGLEDLRRIEEAVGAIVNLVSNLPTPPEVPDILAPAPVSAAPVDLYLLCCELAERRRSADGAAIQCRAFGDPRGHWDEEQVATVLSELLDHAIVHLVRRAPITVSVTGMTRHVRVDIHALGLLSAGKLGTSLEVSSRIGWLPPGALINAIVSRSGGVIFRLRLPRWSPSVPRGELEITTMLKTP